MDQSRRFKRLSATDLPWLLSDGEGPRLSIYLPLAVPGEDFRVNDIRIRNALREADATLGDAGLEKRGRASYVQTLRSADMGRDGAASDGAAGVCAFSDGRRLMLRSSAEPWDELVTVGSRYQILPALPLCRPSAPVFVLALSQNQARLVAVTRFDAEILSLPAGTPKSLEDAVGSEREEQHLQFHASGGSGAAPIYHGQGGGKDDVIPELEAYCRAVARGVEATIGDGRATLLLAADVQLASIYREQASHEIDGVVAGNFDRASARDIRAEIDERLEALEHRELADLCDRYASSKAHEEASADADELLEAARAGRVSELLVEGELSPIRVTDAMKPADAVGNRVCIETLRHGGNVRLVPPRTFPGENGKLAGIYRY